MKRFAFPLERIRQFRKTQIDLEYAKLQRLFEEVRVLDASVASLHSTVDEARSPILASATKGQALYGSDLARIDDYQLYAKQQAEILGKQKQQLLKRVEAQRERLVEARKSFSLLDKLKDRALENWQQEYNKELETLASELYLAKFNRG